MPKGHRPTIATEYRAGPAAPAIDPVITFDDEEDADWFQRLPPAAQEEMRHRWKEANARGRRRVGLAKSTRKRSMTQGALLFFFTETFCAMPSWPHTVAAVLVGAALGALWHRIGADRFRCMLTAALPYAVLRVAFPGDSATAAAIFAVVGFPMLLSFAALIGYDRERRRAEDLDY